jgi:hypothetical protein
LILTIPKTQNAQPDINAKLNHSHHLYVSQENTKIQKDQENAKAAQEDIIAKYMELQHPYYVKEDICAQANPILQPQLQSLVKNAPLDYIVRQELLLKLHAPTDFTL